MKITVITLFPDMLTPMLSTSIVGRAQTDGFITIDYVNPRDFTNNTHRTVDSKPYGGGAGMVMMAEPLHKALEKVTSPTAKVPTSPRLRRTGKSGGRKILLTSPRGTVYSQEKARELSTFDHLVLVAGHYEGVDERFSRHVDEEVSLGDFVLTGGEIVVAAVVDSVVRLLPGVLKKEEATEQESFMRVSIKQLIDIVGPDPELTSRDSKGMTHVSLLEYPQYGRPRTFKGEEVPEVLTSGDHKSIEKWRLAQAFYITVKNRPDMLDVDGQM